MSDKESPADKPEDARVQNDRVKTSELSATLKDEPTDNARPEETLTVDPNTFFQMQLIQHDHDIAVAELKVSELKAQKQKFILDYNVSQVREAKAAEAKAAETNVQAPEENVQADSQKTVETNVQADSQKNS